MKAFAGLSYHCVSFKDEVEVRWISLGPYPLPSLFQADGIQSIDTMALMGYCICYQSLPG